jgi:hypothetical protein
MPRALAGSNSIEQEVRRVVGSGWKRHGVDGRLSGDGEGGCK